MTSATPNDAITNQMGLTACETRVKYRDTFHLKNLYKSLELQGIKLEIDQKAKEKLAIMGFTPKYGARPIIGVIRNQLRRPLSKKIIAGEVSKGSVVSVKLNKKGDIVWKVS